ncbi:MAG: heme-binding protein [Archangiaceae bacterium]|nr:heme-binding protein [Archangiaceae bacterium]
MTTITRNLDVFELFESTPLRNFVPLRGALARITEWPRTWSEGEKLALSKNGLFAGLNLLRSQVLRFITPTPSYESLERHGEVELRRYPKVAVAQVHVHKGFDLALHEGFTKLAAFISGQNHQRHGERDAAETVVNPGESLHMLTPVLTRREAAGHSVSFLMPRGKALDELPVPLDTHVELNELPERTVATLKFRGAPSEDAFTKASHQLLEKVKGRGWKTKGSPGLATYDAPATLPFLRRNEVWVELDR